MAVLALTMALAGGCGDPPDEVPGFVAALAVADGSIRWLTPATGIALGVPSVEGFVVSVLSVHMPLRCQFDLADLEFDAATGSSTGGGPVRPYPTWFTSSDPRVRRLTADGVTYTAVPLPQRRRIVVAPPADAPRPLDGPGPAAERYPLYENTITATAADASTPLWERALPAGDPAALAVADGLLVLASLAGDYAVVRGTSEPIPLRVVALDVTTGDTRWETSISVRGDIPDHRLGMRRAMLAPVAGGQSFNGLLGGEVDPDAPYSGQTSVAIAAGRVFVPRATDELAVLDLTTGQPVGTVEGVGGPVAATRDVVVARRDEDLVGLDAEGRQLWATRLPELFARSGASKDPDVVRTAPWPGQPTVFVAMSGRYGGGPCPLD